MASVFPGLMSSMGIDEDEAQNKQNIFGETEDPQALATQSSGNGQPAGGAINKTSTEGEIANGAPSAGQGVGGGAPVGTNTAGDRAAIKASAGKVKNPNLLDRAQSNLTAQDQKLQNEADAYVTKAKATNYDIGNDEIERGLGGDDAALTKVKSTLNRTATPYEGFKTTADTNLADVDRFQSEAGIKDILRREGGDDYTAGMGALDYSGLQKTPGFNLLARSLADSRSALRQKADTYKTSKSTEAQSAVDANIESSKQKARDYLTSQDAALRAANEQEALAANQGRDARGTAAKDQWRNQSVESLKASNPDLAAYFDGGSDNIDNYFTKEADYNWRDMVDEGESARFERLLGSMGAADSVGRGRGIQGPGFDFNGYQENILGGAKDRQSAAATLVQQQAQAAAVKRAEEEKAATEEVQRVMEEADAARRRDEFRDKQITEKDLDPRQNPTVLVSKLLESLKNPLTSMDTMKSMTGGPIGSGAANRGKAPSLNDLYKKKR